MKSLTKTIAMATIAASAMALSAPAAAQSIVTNGDFSGGFSSWTVTPGNSIKIGTGVEYTPCCSGSVNSGGLTGSTNPFAAFGGGSVANDSYLSQVLSTVAGVGYTVSYRLTALGGGTQSLLATATGSTLRGSLTSAATAGQPFSTYSFSFVADSASTALAFSVTPLGSGVGDGIDVILDDVSVSAAPEPATWGMMILGFGLAGTALRVRRRRPALAA